MKILIAGATGLIGKELVAQCLQKGYTVHYLTTRSSKIKNEAQYKGFLWNPADGEIDDACIQGVSAIINLAGASISKRWTKAYKKEILESRVQSAKVLKTLLEKKGNHTVIHYISASAIGIYPDSLTENYAEEEAAIGQDFLGKTVAAWEEAADSLGNVSLKIAKIRIGLVLAKEGGALAEMVKPIRFGAGAAFGSGKHWQSWIHIEDIAAIFMHILEQKLEGIYNGVAPNPVDNATLTKAIAKTLRKPLFLPNIPEFVMKLVLGEMSMLLFASQKVAATKIEASGFQFKYANLENALQAILKK